MEGWTEDQAVPRHRFTAVDPRRAGYEEAWLGCCQASGFLAGYRGGW